MIKRTILPTLLAHLREKEITIITGARQVGKTYLLSLLQEELTKAGRPFIYLNLDIEEDAKYFVSQADLLAKIKLEMGDAPGVLFVDEIQRKSDAGLFLKGLYDMNLPYKFVVSGSGSMEIKEKIQESLSGRKKVFVLDPVSFVEFVDYRTDYKYQNTLPQFFAVEKTYAKQLFDEYMNYGGYPKVILAPTVEKKTQEIREIYTSYIDKDIKAWLKVEKSQAFSELLKIIASQIGELTNVAELSGTTGLTEKTTKAYLWYLESTYILTKVTPFYQNVRKEITKAPLYYFFDHGLRNYLLGLFGLPDIPSVLSGHLFENVVFNMIRRHISAPTEIHFWRTLGNAEVDFILRTGLTATPVEVKYKQLDAGELTKSFVSFVETYKSKKGYFIHLGNKATQKLGDTEITKLPYYAVDQLS